MVRRQREQTLIALLPSNLTLRMLGFHILLVLRWEWETFWPNTTPLPHRQHFAIFLTSFTSLCRPMSIVRHTKYFTTSVIIPYLFPNCKSFLKFFSIFFLFVKKPQMPSSFWRKISIGCVFSMEFLHSMTIERMSFFRVALAESRDCSRLILQSSFNSLRNASNGGRPSFIGVITKEYTWLSSLCRWTGSGNPFP